MNRIKYPSFEELSTAVNNIRRRVVIDYYRMNCSLG